MPREAGLDLAMREEGLAPGCALTDAEAAQFALELGEHVAHAGENAPAVLKARGRPAGAKNRVTRETIEMLRRLGHKDPLIGLGEAFSMGPQGIAKWIGLSRKDALDRWIAIADKLLPYWHQKQPIAVDAQGASLVPIMIQLGGESAANSTAYDFSNVTVAGSDQSQDD